MLEIVTDKGEIRRAQGRFRAAIRDQADEQIPVQVGYRGGSPKYNVVWSSCLNIWSVSDPYLTKNRYWNAFGIGKPEKGDNVSIVCEINFLFEGLSRRIGGAFAKDNSGQIFVVHRGNIGGGRKDIGKNLFINNYSGEKTVVKDGNLQTEVALVADLQSRRFGSQIMQFVYEVDRIKHIALSSVKLNKTVLNIPEFKKEFAGKKQYQIAKDIEADCDDRLIVNSLASILQSRGYRVGKDIRKDLCIFDKRNKIAAIFEVKTDISSTSLYTAIGQLLLGGTNFKKPPRLILAIPTKVSHVLQKSLNKLGIELLIFKLKKDRITFPNLGSVKL